MTKQIQVGTVPVGGGAPVAIQSMCNTRTDDVEATVQQILRLEAAGCEIIRVAVPDWPSARAIGAIRERIHIPLVVDIHFDYKLALEMPADRRGSPSALESMAVAWKSRCWKSTGRSVRRPWWNPPLAIFDC